MVKELLDRLSSYNIFNYLFPGILFAALGDKFTSYSFLLGDHVIGVFVYYFYGVVISRIGSIIIEPILKTIKFLKFAPYNDFVKASKVDTKIELLSETNNMYRTLTSTFICLFLVYVYQILENAYPGMPKYTITLALIILVILFTYSYRKQTSFIRERISQVLESESVQIEDTEDDK